MAENDARNNMRVREQLDYETDSSHSVTVEVTDAVGNTYSDEPILGDVAVSVVLQNDDDDDCRS